MCVWLADRALAQQYSAVPFKRLFGEDGNEGRATLAPGADACLSCLVVKLITVFEVLSTRNNKNEYANPKAKDDPTARPRFGSLP